MKSILFRVQVVGVVNIKFSQKEQAKFVLRTIMQRLVATGKTMQQTHKRTVAAASRAFASSPQPNPFDTSIKTSLEHGGSSHNYYKLPALGDSRTCKCSLPLFRRVAHPLFSSLRSHPSLLHQSSLGECCPQLRRLQREGVRH